MPHQGEVQEARQVATPRPGRGFFITLEGIDRCGKSTQADRLRDALLGRELPVGFEGGDGEILREPGGTPAGEQVRDVLLHHSHRITAWAEALLYAAARAQLVDQVVGPSLAAGWVVVCDRYLDSSLAYQGHARGLGLERVLELNAWATGGLLPDLTFLIEVATAAAAVRGGGGRDRIEREGREFQEKVAAGYREVAARFPQRVVVIDGERAVDEIAAEVERVALERLEAGRV